jgi:hypothetical protein
LQKRDREIKRKRGGEREREKALPDGNYPIRRYDPLPRNIAVVEDDGITLSVVVVAAWEVLESLTDLSVTG